MSVVHLGRNIKEPLGSGAQGNDHPRASELDSNGLQVILETS